MQTLFSRLYHDEEGFILSAELILIATIVVLSMVVGLAEVGSAINHELTDVSDAFDAVNNGSPGDFGNSGGQFGNNGGSNSGGDIVVN